jgi:tetratricopeptide (TPR) repeat protein
MTSSATSAENSADTLARAAALLKQQRVTAAERLCRRILRTEPGHAGALHLLGLSAKAAGNLAAAISLVQQAIEADSSVASYHANLCELYRQAGRLDEALASGLRALALEPASPQASNALGIVHYDRGEHGAACDRYRLAIAVSPRFAEAHSNLGNAFQRLRRDDEAIAAYRSALAINPRFAACWSNLGLTFSQLGRHDEALDAYRSAVEADPLYGDGHVGVALQSLLRGDFAKGWLEYQWRFRSTQQSPLRMPWPEWQGDPLAGRHILLVAEQGIGDTIQFCRYAHLLRPTASVSLMVPPTLVRLLSASLPWTTVVAAGQPTPSCDVYCPMLSLPMRLGTTEETIPAAIPYLRVPAGLDAPWQARLAQIPAPRIGLVWAGNPRHLNDLNRSLPPPVLSPLFDVAALSWVSLQIGPRAAEAKLMTGRIVDVTPMLGDFLDTAALLSSLDLVISVDTAVAHLAGALGLPIWLLLPVGNDWRWQLDREDSPWYPTMRLYRQPVYGDWAPVMSRVAEALLELTCGGRTA